MKIFVGLVIAVFLGSSACSLPTSKSNGSRGLASVEEVLEEGQDLQGKEVGNGGSALVCYDRKAFDDQGKPIAAAQVVGTPELTDYWEQSEISVWKLDMGVSGVGYRQKAANVLDRLKRVDPARSERLLLRLAQFDQVFSLLRKAEPPASHDRTLRVKPRGRENCYDQTIAFQVKNPGQYEKKILVDGPLFNRMSEDSKAGLILHELLYEEDIGVGAKSSDKVRSFTFLISSNYVAQVQHHEFMTYVLTEGLDYGKGKYYLEPWNVWVKFVKNSEESGRPGFVLVEDGKLEVAGLRHLVKAGSTVEQRDDRKWRLSLNLVSSEDFEFHIGGAVVRLASSSIRLSTHSTGEVAEVSTGPLSDGKQTQVSILHNGVETVQLSGTTFAVRGWYRDGDFYSEVRGASSRLSLGAGNGLSLNDLASASISQSATGSIKTVSFAAQQKIGFSIERSRLKGEVRNLNLSFYPDGAVQNGVVRGAGGTLTFGDEILVTSNSDESFSGFSFGLFPSGSLKGLSGYFTVKNVKSGQSLSWVNLDLDKLVDVSLTFDEGGASAFVQKDGHGRMLTRARLPGASQEPVSIGSTDEVTKFYSGFRLKSGVILSAYNSGERVLVDASGKKIKLKLGRHNYRVEFDESGHALSAKEF